jgi:ketosteroid isomerase-like protein
MRRALPRSATLSWKGLPVSGSRRSLLAAAAASLASSDAIAGTPAQRLPTDQDVADPVRRSEDAHAALMRGDLAGYRALMPHTSDFTLMAPFGGKPTHASELTEERWTSIGQFFRNGVRSTLELIRSYRATDMVVLAVIERTHVAVGGLPEQDWSPRVTLVFRREANEWRLAHRHADPLVKGISVAQSAALALP